MLIRAMTLTDLPAVHAIESESFLTPWSYDAFVEELTSNKAVARYIVAEIDGTVAGYGGMWLVVDEAHITNIAVDSRFRRQGVGLAVTSGLIGLARELGIRYMTLEVRRSNAAAQVLYRRLGFVDVGYRKRYYEDNNEDALIMVIDNLQGEGVR